MNGKKRRVINMMSSHLKNDSYITILVEENDLFLRNFGA